MADKKSKYQSDCEEVLAALIEAECIIDVEKAEATLESLIAKDAEEKRKRQEERDSDPFSDSDYYESGYCT